MADRPRQPPQDGQQAIGMDDPSSDADRPRTELKADVAAMDDGPHTLVRPARIRGTLLRRVRVRAVLRRAPVAFE